MCIKNVTKIQTHICLLQKNVKKDENILPVNLNFNPNNTKKLHFCYLSVVQLSVRFLVLFLILSRISDTDRMYPETFERKITIRVLKIAEKSLNIELMRDNGRRGLCSQFKVSCLETPQRELIISRLKIPERKV